MPKKFLFSTRTAWKLDVNNITSSLDGIKKSQVEYLDLTESNPTKCCFKFNEKEILQVLNNKVNLNYQPLPKGHEKARQIIQDYYRQKGVEISLEQIFLTSSTSEAYSCLFRLLANEGERIAFPTPSYPLFEFLVDLNDLEMDFYRINYQDGWQIDLANLKHLMRSNQKAITLVNPNNPTGSYTKKEELAQINKLAQENTLAIICDEVFLDYNLTAGLDRATLAGNNETLTFVLSGISKILALPQMKLSWIVVNGPEDLRYEAISRLEVISDTYLSVSTPIQNALEFWFKLKDDIQSQIKSRLVNNIKTLNTDISPFCGSKIYKVEGGWYAVIRIGEDLDEEDFVIRLLNETQTLVHPGYFFDIRNGSHIVLSLITKEDVFKEGIKRLNDFIVGR